MTYLVVVLNAFALKSNVTPKFTPSMKHFRCTWLMTQRSAAQHSTVQYCRDPVAMSVHRTVPAAMLANHRPPELAWLPPPAWLPPRPPSPAIVIAVVPPRDLRLRDGRRHGAVRPHQSDRWAPRGWHPLAWDPRVVDCEPALVQDMQPVVGRGGLVAIRGCRDGEGVLVGGGGRRRGGVAGAIGAGHRVSQGFDLEERGREMERKTVIPRGKAP